MKNGTEYIVNKIKEYSKIPSLTYKEDKFLTYLSKDIPLKKYTLYNQYPNYLLYRYNGDTRWLVLAHTDRIKVHPFDFRMKDNYLHGQLDNVISVAICRYLMKLGMPMDFMFTTMEETCQSHAQILEVWFDKQDYKILDMDIDVLYGEDAWEANNGMISLRDRDNLALYDKEFVAEIRGIAEKNNIEYVKKDGHWLVAQPGTVLERDNRVKIMYVGIVIANYHSNKEYVNLKAVEKVIKLFEGIKSWKSKKEYVTI